MENHINGTVILQLDMTLVCWIVGWLLGGPKLESQAISTATRNVGICMPLALPWRPIDVVQDSLAGE